MIDKYICPCCGFKTLGEKPPGTYAICPVCRWEDDPVQFDDPNFEGGSNTISLIQARENYHKIGAITIEDMELARPPREDERPI